MRRARIATVAAACAAVLAVHHTAASAPRGPVRPWAVLDEGFGRSGIFRLLVPSVGAGDDALQEGASARKGVLVCGPDRRRDVEVSVEGRTRAGVRLATAVVIATYGSWAGVGQRAAWSAAAATLDRLASKLGPSDLLSVWCHGGAGEGLWRAAPFAPRGDAGDTQWVQAALDACKPRAQAVALPDAFADLAAALDGGALGEAFEKSGADAYLLVVASSGADARVLAGERVALDESVGAIASWLEGRGVFAALAWDPFGSTAHVLEQLARTTRGPHVQVKAPTRESMGRAWASLGAALSSLRVVEVDTGPWWRGGTCGPNARVELVGPSPQPVWEVGALDLPRRPWPWATALALAAAVLVGLVALGLLVRVLARAVHRRRAARLQRAAAQREALDGLARGWLVGTEGPCAGLHLPLFEGEQTLGSSSECDLVLADRTVSRVHARLRVEAMVFHLEDLGSRNGTRVGGCPASAVYLRDGDEVSFGASTFRLELRRGASRRAAAPAGGSARSPLPVAGPQTASQGPRDWVH